MLTPSEQPKPPWARVARGEFWEMHDYLFEHQAALDAENLVRAAIAVGLDKVRFGAGIRQRPPKMKMNGTENNERDEPNEIGEHLGRPSVAASAGTGS